MNWQQLLRQIGMVDVKALARTISLVENDYSGSKELLSLLPSSASMKMIGITGAPGAGKSSLADALISLLINEGKKIAVICVDPSSPFTHGALLGDRIRMSKWYNHPNVFIRSLASRGSFGGLHPRIIEICDIVKSAPYDYVIVETVGVGQSEIEITGLADTTVVVLVPEAGDEIQTMKAGLMEIADVFVVNKSDRPGADALVKNMRTMLAPAFNKKDPIKIIKTNALANEGITDLWGAISHCMQQAASTDKKYWLLAEKAFYLIQQDRLRNISKKDLKADIERLIKNGYFNLYQYVASIIQ